MFVGRCPGAQRSTAGPPLDSWHLATLRHAVLDQPATLCAPAHPLTCVTCVCARVSPSLLQNELRELWNLLNLLLPKVFDEKAQFTSWFDDKINKGSYHDDDGEGEWLSARACAGLALEVLRGFGISEASRWERS